MFSFVIDGEVSDISKMRFWGRGGIFCKQGQRALAEKSWKCNRKDFIIVSVFNRPMAVLWGFPHARKCWSLVSLKRNIMVVLSFFHMPRSLHDNKIKILPESTFHSLGSLVELWVLQHIIWFESNKVLTS